MKTTAKLFMHGRSQAVRLPKAFRFDGQEVRISKVGETVVLEPMTIDTETWWCELDALRSDADGSFLDNERPPQPQMSDRDTHSLD